MSKSKANNTINCAESNKSRLGSAINIPVSLTLETNASGKVGFYSTSQFQGPGVGKYKVEQCSLEMKKKSPKATIGNESRFPKENPLLHYVPNLPLNGFEQKPAS